MCSGTEEIDRMREHFRWGNTLGSVELTVHSPPFNSECSSAVRSVWMVCILSSSLFPKKERKKIIHAEVWVSVLIWVYNEDV